jgi:pullulanase/glycogen debranching enzyme
VVNRSRYEWKDSRWLALREDSEPLREPMSIYEVHLGSWRLNPLEDNRSLTYLELADELAAYVTDLGFTHVELMPVMATRSAARGATRSPPTSPRRRASARPTSSAPSSIACTRRASA